MVSLLLCICLGILEALACSFHQPANRCTTQVGMPSCGYKVDRSETRNYKDFSCDSARVDFQHVAYS